MKLTRLLTLALILALVGTSSIMAEDRAECVVPCRKFESCVVFMWTEAKQTLKPEHKNALYPGCMKTCNNKTNTPKVQQCYKESGGAAPAAKNTCMAYYGCVQRMAPAPAKTTPTR